MKKIVLVLCIINFALNLHSQTQQPVNMARLHVKLDFPDTIPLVIQLAVFTKNPFVIYDSIITSNKSFIESKFQETEDTIIMQNQVTSAMTFFWDNVFRQITGFEVNTLSSRPNDLTIYTINDPGDNLWVASKTCFFKDFFICWCLPVQLKPGNEYKLTFNKDNYLDLFTLFSYIMAGKPPLPQDQGK